MRSEPFLGRTVTSFRKAYPEVRTLRLEATHHGDMRHEPQRKDVYSESRVPSKIPCPEPDLQGWWLRLNTIIMTLTHGKTTSYQTRWSCRGREGSRRTQVNPYSCMNSVELNLEITYHE